MQILLILILILPFWFLIITPQRRRQREHQQLVASLAAGDRVEGFSGIHGTLTEVRPETVRMEIADGVVITMARMAVASRLVEPGAAESADVDGPATAVATAPEPNDDAPDQATEVEPTDRLDEEDR